MPAAAMTVARVQLQYAGRGQGLAAAALAGARECIELRHYPAGDVHDPVRRTRFFYHAHHSSRFPREEHGHFHLFQYTSPDSTDFFHLAALSLDRRGQALRWFTTNRWVTDERWQPAAEMRPAVAAFQVRTHGRLAPVARWLSAMVRLYADEIAELHLARDAALASYVADQGWAAASEDRHLDVLSECPIDLPARLAALTERPA